MSEPRRVQEPRTEGWELLKATLARGWRAVRERASLLFARERRLELLTVVGLAGGTLLIIGEFLTLFEISRGSVPVAEQTGGDHHSYALLVIGAAGLIAVLVARAGEWPPAAGVALLGALALAILLIADLPDATSSGLIAGARAAEAEPAAGFWVQTVGALLLLASGVVMTHSLRNNERQPSG